MARPRKPPPKPARRTYGTGSVSRQPDGAYRARLPAKIDPKRTAREFRTEAEALAWLAAALQPAAPVPDPAPVAHTVESWAVAWWESNVQAVRAPNTASVYLSALRTLAPLYATPLADVRRSQLQAVVATISAQVEPITVREYVGVWRRCLDAAVDDELLPRNPARHLALPIVPPPGPKRFVSQQEAAILLDAIVGHRFEAAYALLLGCGLRIGEVLGLEWRHVDLAGRRAWIERQWTNSRWRALPKGRRARWARLPPATVAALIRHRDAQPDGTVLVMESPYASRGHGGHRLRQDGEEPKPWSRPSVARDLDTLVAGLELPRLTSRAARRGLITALLDGGVSPAVAAERAGHQSPHVTLDSYSQASDEGQERADSAIDRYLGGE